MGGREIFLEGTAAAAEAAAAAAEGAATEDTFLSLAAADPVAAAAAAAAAARCCRYPLLRLNRSLELALLRPLLLLLLLLLFSVVVALSSLFTFFSGEAALAALALNLSSREILLLVSPSSSFPPPSRRCLASPLLLLLLQSLPLPQELRLDVDEKLLDLDELGRTELKSLSAEERWEEEYEVVLGLTPPSSLLKLEEVEEVGEEDPEETSVDMRRRRLRWLKKSLLLALLPRPLAKSFPELPPLPPPALKVRSTLTKTVFSVTKLLFLVGAMPMPSLPVLKVLLLLLLLVVEKDSLFPMSLRSSAVLSGAGSCWKRASLLFLRLRGSEEKQEGFNGGTASSSSSSSFSRE